jgi:signal transduction histidine kinase
VADLRPTTLDECGLPTAVRAFAHHVLEPVGATVEIETSGLAGRLPPAVETVLFRIIQESLINGFREHSIISLAWFCGGAVLYMGGGAA